MRVVKGPTKILVNVVSFCEPCMAPGAAGGREKPALGAHGAGCSSMGGAPPPTANFFLKTQLRYHRLSEALSALQAGRTLFPDPCHPLGLLQSRYIHTLLCLFVFVFGCAGSLLLRGLFSSCAEQGLLSRLLHWQVGSLPLV